MATGPRDIQDRVDDLSHVDCARPASLLLTRDEEFNQVSLLVRQITRIWLANRRHAGTPLRQCLKSSHVLLLRQDPRFNFSDRL